MKTLDENIHQVTNFSHYRYGILGEQLNKFTEDLEENENKDLTSPQSQ